ncbi:MAG: hypothetical protein WBP83_06870 [Nitrososphaeraceae archaeon]
MFDPKLLVEEYKGSIRRLNIGHKFWICLLHMNGLLPSHQSSEFASSFNIQTCDKRIVSTEYDDNLIADLFYSAS